MSLSTLLLMWVASRAPIERHVVIVGVNASVDAGVAPLSYADDDAARYAELLAPDAASLALLTVLDPDAQAQFPSAASAAIPPRRAELEEALSSAFTAIRRARAEGREADLVFIYAGHGAVDEAGEGYVSLLGGRFTRTDLFATVIDPSPARYNHVIVDACSAYLLLHRGNAVQAVEALLASSSLEAHPNTGALLATSRDQATHEWSRIRAGVFSHQVLSALAGAADVDGDGAVDYAEIGSFVESANSGVNDSRARIDLALLPPRALFMRPLWASDPDGASMTGVVLELAAADTGRFTITDGRGSPVIDVNKSSEQPSRSASPVHRRTLSPTTRSTSWPRWTCSA